MHCLARGPLFGGVLKSIWMVVSKRERGKAFLLKPIAITPELGIV